MKFVKENKTIVFALVIVLLCFVLLALPGQFAHFVAKDLNSHIPSERFQYRLSGFEWIFATRKNSVTSEAIGKVTAHGISMYVLLVLCIPGLLFSKKSSFVSLLTSLALITVAILFFTLTYVNLKAYSSVIVNGEFAEEFNYLMWVPWLVGGLTMLAGLLMSYRTFKVLKDEVKQPMQASKGPKYSYLNNK